MLHQVPTEWEVVDAYAVKPVRVYVEDDGATIVRLASHEIVGCYTFDMAEPAPVRPPHRKRHSHDGSSAPSTSGSTSQSSSTPQSRRASHPSTTTRPQISSQQPQPPKPTRLNSAISFFRPQPHRHISSGSSNSDSDSGLSTASGSGSSDGDSEAVPGAHKKKRSLLPLGRKRRGSTEDEHDAVAKATIAPAKAKTEAYRKADLKRAVTFARGELMKQVHASGKNGLVLEGWSITVLRNSNRYRLSIEYTGRPAILSYAEPSMAKSDTDRIPPFLEVINDQ